MFALNASRPCRISSFQHSQKTLIRRIASPIPFSASKPKLLQSLDLHAVAESTWVEGLGVVPYSWGVPSGRLYSQGVHICDLPELQHLGISFEAGPIELGRDQYHSTLLTTVLSKLERRHVGAWLFEAAAKKDAAYLFECHPALKAWLLQLAEQKFGKHGFLLVQHDCPSAQAAADWLQRLSSSFSKELHTVPVAFACDTQHCATQILFNWLLELPDTDSAAAASTGDLGQQAHAKVDQGRMGGGIATTVCMQHASTESVMNGEASIAAAATFPQPDSAGSEVRDFLQAVAKMIPGSPKLLIKRLPSPGSKLFSDRAQANSGVPAAAALAAVAAATPAAAAAAATAAAAGYVDSVACICIADGLLSKEATAAAFHVVIVACEGLGLSSSQCMAAIEAVAAAALPATPLLAQGEPADSASPAIHSALFESSAATRWQDGKEQFGGTTHCDATSGAVHPGVPAVTEQPLVVLAV